MTTTTKTTREARRQPPIAIVGMGALFPGSLDVAQFWGHILAKSDLITEIPKTHWRVEDYFDADPNKPDKTYAKVGGFLPEVAFDPLENGIPPNLLSQTDTSQLLALMIARTTLQDATKGALATVDKSRISTILGVTSGQELFGQMASRLRRPEWEAGMRAAGLDDETIRVACDKISETFVPWTESAFPGLLGNVVAGRIANRLDLGGSNAVTDAACASSFAAISMGIDELVLGRADMVLTGGVDALNDIFMFMCFSKTPALSAKGKIRPFDVDADGTLLGEGVGMIALKRQEDAERDGDAIYAIIRGVGTSSDGRSKSVYAPVSEGQAKALTRAYEVAGYGPDTVELVEAHGTGTKAGDVAEVGGLKLAFDASGRRDRGWCAIGSVKSQIGHTKSAAGAAGLMKAALALHEGVLPPTINVDTPNPKLGLDESPFYVNTEARPWVRSSSHPRRASVSSFGFGGSNWHITLEEYAGPGRRAPRLTTRSHEVLLASASSTAALAERLAAIGDELLSRSLAQAAKAAAERATSTDGFRIALVVDSVSAAQKALDAARAKLTKGDDPRAPGTYFGQGAKDGALAFVFSGQGSQYTGMGRDLAIHVDDARRALDRADGVLSGHAISRTMFPPPSFTDTARAADEARLRATENAQPALAAHELSVLAVLDAFGVAPDMVAGHSFGEIMALARAGVFSADDAVRIARRRGELMAEASAVPGAMAAMSASSTDVRAHLARLALTGVVVANENAPEQTVIAGAKDAIERALKALGDVGVRGSLLPVSTAFHSALVAPAAEKLLAFLEGIPFSSPTMPVFANTTGAPYPEDAGEIRRVLARQLAEPVRFVDEISALYARGARTFVEVGPSAVLTGLVGRILADKPHAAIAVDAKGKSGLATLLSAVGQLFARGVDVRLASLFSRDPVVSTSAESKKRGPTVAITGANVGKPALPLPVAPRAKSSSSTTNGAHAPVSSSPASSQAPSPALPSVSPVMDARTPRSAPPVSSSPASSAPAPRAPSSSWIEVFREGQEQTASAHAAYQRALTDAHTAYLSSVERSTRDLLAMLSGAPSTTTVAASPAPRTLPAIAAPSLLTPATVPTTAAPTTAPVVVAPATAARPAAQTAPSLDVRGLFLDVVAEKTGYPKDALHDDMSLEADLGIDSIKRVEILSAIKAKAPSLPDVDAMTLAKLQTLGAVAQALTPAGGALAATSTTIAPATSARASSLDVRGLFLDVVAEKTGYPKDALQNDMSLEADLGIDSIKRVEILSAIKAKAPSLPDVDAMTLAKLQTLGAVAQALTPTGGALAATSTTIAPATSSRASSLDVRGLFLDVVAEKTGYPKDALHDDMSLEADLGIDSIKRVEILSAMKSKAPSLPEVDALTLAKLQTLGAIIAALGPTMSSSVATTQPKEDRANGVAALDVRALFLDVVAEKTGYPKDALHDDMSLEADLGIDSIKRVEILSAMKSKAPSLPEVDALTLAKLQTLGAIIAALGPTMTASSSPSTAKAATAAARSTPTARAPVSVVGVVDAPRAQSVALPALTGRTIGVFGADAARVDAVVDALVAAGTPAESLPASGLNGHSGRLFALVLVDGGSPCAGADVATARLKASFKAVKDALPGLVDHRGQGFVLALTPGGGDFGASRLDVAHAPLFGLAGLAKTAALEIAGLRAKCLDVDAAQSPQSLAALVIDELRQGFDTLEVGQRGERRLARALSPLAAPLVDDGGLDRPVTVATGGARGVTAECLIAWSSVARPRLAILARSPRRPDVAPSVLAAPAEGLLAALVQDAAKRGVSLAPKDARKTADLVLASREIEKNLARMEAAGADVLYVVADASDKASVARALDEVRARFGSIEVLVHGAGVLADRRIEDKTLDDVERVLSTKLDGALALLAATERDPVRSVVFFSSVAGRFGNVGQSDYAMANEALSGLAAALRHRARSDGRVVNARALSWGPWDGGMVTPSLRRHFEGMGVPLIALDDGARVFVEQLSTRAPSTAEVVVGGPITSHASAPAARENDVLRVDGRVMPMLADHSVKGVPVLPAVFAADMLVAAVERATAKRVVDVRDLRVLRGVRLAHFSNGGDTLRVRLDDKGMNVVHAELFVVGETAPRYRADLVVGDQAPALESASPPTGPRVPVPLAALYGEGAQFPLFHGPGFQLLSHVETVGDALVARAKGLGATGWRAPFTVDTAVLDAALQLALVHATREVGGRFLPTSIGTLTRMGPHATTTEWTLTLRAERVEAGRVLSRVEIVDDQGRLCYALTGVEVHRLPDEQASGGARSTSVAGA